MNDTHVMQAFFDQTDAFFYIKDGDGRFLLVNRKGAEALQLTQAECVGKTAYDLVSKEEADRVTEVDRRVVETGQPYTFRDEVNLPTGRRTLLDHKFPLSLPGHTGAIGGIVFDITDAG